MEVEAGLFTAWAMAIADLAVGPRRMARIRRFSDMNQIANGLGIALGDEAPKPHHPWPSSARERSSKARNSPARTGK